MRGFSLIEMLLAFALASIALTAALAAVLGLPVAVRNIEFKAGAISMSRTVLTEAVVTGKAVATTSGVYASSVLVMEGEDVAITLLRAATSWKDALGMPQKMTFVMQAASDDVSNPCDDFVEGNWSKPILRASYPLQPGQGIPAFQSAGSYDVAGLAASSSTLAAAVGSSTEPGAPTLLVYSVQGTDPSLTYAAGFDNASSSRIGFSSVALAGGYVFAGNAFGSRSAQTCADGVSCSQIQIFSLFPNARRLASLQLPVYSPPFAITSSGATASVVSLFYYQGYLYTGLEKTNGGNEFNIIDVRDPSRPSWLSGIPIGRTVSSITVRGTTAYVSTDDPKGELVVVDVANPYQPQKLGTYDAQGSTGFGYGAVLKVRDGIARFGRSYSPNGPELEILDVRNPADVTRIWQSDVGTSKDPESLRSLASIDTLTFALFTKRLIFIDTTDAVRPVIYSQTYALPAGSTGAALSCRDNLIYLARNTATGAIIDVLSGS